MSSPRALGDHLLVAFRRARFLGRDEGRADIAEVRAGRLRRKHRAAGGDRAGERQRPVEPFADFLDQREGRQHAGMSAGAGRHGDDAVRALLDRLAARTGC